MRFWLTAVFVLNLNTLSIHGTKKEDLERAAELAVERAAERVAERAVEKALEAGNSTTTTVTVKEGYSNARKVAEEQAAPGSESTRYQTQNPQYPIEYSAEFQPEPHLSSAEYEYTEDDHNNDKQQPYKEADFEWHEEESPDGGNYGLKENTQMQSKNGQHSDYQDDNKPDLGEEDLYVDEPEDDENQNKAWQAYSNWESNFRRLPKEENWESGKSFWSGEDSFFWDMENAELKHTDQKVDQTKVVEPDTSQSKNRMWKSKDHPEDFFRWDSERQYASSTDRPESREYQDESPNRNRNSKRYTEPEIYTFEDYQSYWTDKQFLPPNSWKIRQPFKKDQATKDRARSAERTNANFKKAPEKIVWKDHAQSQEHAWSDSKASEEDPWKDQNYEKDRARPWLKERGHGSGAKVSDEDEKMEFWAPRPEPKNVNKKKQFLNNDFWESRQISRENLSNDKETEMINLSMSDEAMQDNGGQYSPAWRGTDTFPEDYRSEELDVSASTNRRGPYKNKSNSGYKNKTLPKNVDNYQFTVKPVLKGNEKFKEKLVPGNIYPGEYRNKSPFYDSSEYRLYFANKDMPKGQDGLKPSTTNQPKPKASVLMDPYSGYVLNPYKPYINPFDYYTNQFRYQNTFNPYKIKPQVPLHYQRTQYPQVNNLYKLQSAN